MVTAGERGGSPHPGHRPPRGCSAGTSVKRCVKVCLTSLAVTSNNAGLAIKAISSLLAINHRLTVVNRGGKTLSPRFLLRRLRLPPCATGAVGWKALAHQSRPVPIPISIPISIPSPSLSLSLSPSNGAPSTLRHGPALLPRLGRSGAPGGSCSKRQTQHFANRDA